jgi:hypothetical protein
MKPNVQAALEQFTHADTQDMWEAAKLLASEADLEVLPELLQVLVASADLQRRIAGRLRTWFDGRAGRSRAFDRDS